MQVFFDALAAVLAFFYDLVPNYAFAIIMLTLVVMVVVTPLTLKGTRSMMMMQQLQPEMRKIQTRYKDDRQKLNEELLKFYKENNINPLGGCLPLLVQMPVFLVLYQVLRGLTRRVTDMGFDVGWASNLFAAGDPITEAPAIERAFDPSYVNESSSLYQSLAGSTEMDAFGMDLSQSASQALGEGILTALPFLILIAIVGATGFIQQRQIQGRNPGASINPQQQMIMKIMPIFLPVISFGLPAGLVVYFAVSNLYRIGQQAFISRSIYGMKKGQPSVLAGKGGDDDAAPQQSFREMFGLAKKNAETTAKAKAAKPTPAKSGARSKSAAKTGGSAKGGTATKTSAKSGAKSGAKRPSKSSSGKSAAGNTPPPTLQPRARKNQKKR
ncbi:YidC/Oxa1 family membrane protein insertase [Rhabdothermincola salaria]|uniref:YidC/Oxa1 family membrane protein insertase n=1 Tax=Rhabdothermincola salaria TaxID=2903142 RepID=UPI001E57A8C9|nr:YidC/Oxa1 family membrane protein insertase [Rhabdothermincola salaria]MCD9624450.1 YidC/Oxa1 family membrane protein insertase [Rhabdothermincola salaria]